ncbi:MAG: GNAT family N-acetyltransferase [Anaerolineaceae bacterium]|nr:GNAT family N-acetyltransferase [Anaerolineaceae bacterium]
MQIDIMKAEDYEGVYQLWLRTPGMGLNDVDDSEAGICKYLARNPNTCFVAKENDQVIGVILSGHDGRRGYIHHTAVDLNLRNKGIGTALLNHALDALKEEGISKAALVVFARNEIGNQFWDHQGFTTREDLIYRNRNLRALKRMDT